MRGTEGTQVTYTLADIYAISDVLQRQVDDSMDRIRLLASEGDEWALAVVAEWERLGDPVGESE